jgi:hypothetical protein
MNARASATIGGSAGWAASRAAKASKARKAAIRRIAGPLLPSDNTDSFACDLRDPAKAGSPETRAAFRPAVRPSPDHDRNIPSPPK